jgi:4-alpha-glucanotransferase
MQKIIGTFVPINALKSTVLSSQNNGTFAVGKPFLTWLHETHQSAWQVLPLHETQLEKGSVTKHVPSPYKSYGIGLSPKYLDSVFAKKMPTEVEKRAFIKKHQAWIEEYALFCSLRDRFKTDDWRVWPDEIRNRDHKMLEVWRNTFADAIDFYIVQQWQLHESLHALRHDAKTKGIALIGDLPFYPSVQSPVVWANQSAFLINDDGTLPYVSGIPDLEGTHFGRQIWGHPLYKWENKKDVILFWKLRLKYLSEVFDWVRFDHGKGFFSYGVINLHDEKQDHFVHGPGGDVLEELVSYSKSLGLQIFVEDSGKEIPAFHATLNKLDIAGIKILRFLLKNKTQSVFEGSPHTVAYTTTHDTETLLGYLHKVKPHRKKLLASLMRLEYTSNDTEFAHKLRDAIIASPAEVVIIPIQDWLLITDRINIPGTEREVRDPNWRFRLKIPVEELPDINE